MKALLDQHLATRAEILKRFGWKKTWHVSPIEDMTDWYWMVDRGDLMTSEHPFTEASIVAGDNIFSAIITGAAVHAEGFTLAPVDTETDGNIFLYALDDSKECKDDELKHLYAEHW